jgi:hypothetical protein
LAPAAGCAARASRTAGVFLAAAFAGAIRRERFARASPACVARARSGPRPLERPAACRATGLDFARFADFAFGLAFALRFVIVSIPAVSVQEKRPELYLVSTPLRAKS